MAINRGKRISELTALTSASLNTTIVGVDNGTTYKIELDTLADAVTSRVNTLDRERLQSLESVTSSFETKGRSVISSSAQITNLGFISTSVNISALNSFTASQSTLNTAFTNGISARLQTSSFNDFSASVDQRILDATNEQSLSHLATTGSNTFRGSQTVNGFVSASYYRGSGRYLTNLTPTTNWNYEQEFSVKNTEQLTFSGDYILENTYLAVNGVDEEIEYSTNKSFKREGSIFIGGNLLVKDSYIENDGLISVGGEVILIGNSQIVGTGKII